MQLLTVKETADYLRLPLTKTYELVRIKDFPAVKIGKSWRVMRDKLDEWLLAQLEDKPENV